MWINKCIFGSGENPVLLPFLQYCENAHLVSSFLSSFGEKNSICQNDSWTFANITKLVELTEAGEAEPLYSQHEWKIQFRDDLIVSSVLVWVQQRVPSFSSPSQPHCSPESSASLPKFLSRRPSFLLASGDRSLISFRHLIRSNFINMSTTWLSLPAVSAYCSGYHSFLHNQALPTRKTAR